jgi:hypothetical protein
MKTLEIDELFTSCLKQNLQSLTYGLVVDKKTKK